MTSQNGSLFSAHLARIAELLDISYELGDLKAVESVLSWDQNVMLPSGAAQARANQLGTLATIYHEKISRPRIGTLIAELERLKPEALNDCDRSLIRHIRKAHLEAVKTPGRLVREFAEATSAGHESWKAARKASDFELFRNDLARIIVLTLEQAEICAGITNAAEPYDALLDKYESGMTSAELDRIFPILKAATIEVLAKIKKSGRTIDRDFLRHIAPARDALDAFSRRIITAMGYDFTRGRLDESVHPFCMPISGSDVRITTRYGEGFFFITLLSTVHEAGHALYEQGVDPRLSRTPLSTGASLGFHESQSRLWENIIARSPAFWNHWYEPLRSELPGLPANGQESFVRAMNAVEPIYIRTDSDEVTYNLHIILRYEIERALISGQLSVDDIPSAWNEKIGAYLGLDAPGGSDGALQDIHWSMGAFGYFPTYSLGNLIGAQLVNTMRKEIPEPGSEMTPEYLASVREWLRENVHRFGATYEPADLLPRITGESLDPEHFSRYLNEKYGALYGF